MRVWAAAQALREKIGALLPPKDKEEQEREVAKTQEEMGAEAFAAAWAEARSMSLEQAIAYALGNNAGSQDSQTNRQMDGLILNLPANVNKSAR